VENSNGYSVIIAELTGYAKRTRHLVNDLDRLGTHRIRSVRTLAEQVGPITKETGFAAALSRFAEALEHQLVAAAKDADALGDSVAKAEASYRKQDEARAKELIAMIRGGAR
jgi:hypothetical protein